MAIPEWLWPYHAPSLSPLQLAQRHEALLLYARIAHLSSLLPLLIAILLRLTAPLHRSLSSLSLSPSTRSCLSSPCSRCATATTLRKVSWWLTDDLPIGRRDEWILGLAWSAWCLTLSIHGTGHDYFHLTKRFGIVAVAQLPAQYLLALRPLNPYSWAFGCDHEHLNRYHRLLGSIVYGMLLVHLLLFNSFFLRTGQWVTQLDRPVIQLGHALTLVFQALALTALVPRVRRYSYRVFFLTHVLVAVGVPCLIFFHAVDARPYVAQALAFMALDLIVRAYSTLTVPVRPSSLAIVPHTSLVRMVLPLPSSDKTESFRAMPAAHVYLRIYGAESPLFNLLFNPFSVSSVTKEGITLVARTRAGPMTKTLAGLASHSQHSQHSQHTGISTGTVSLGIEGPYGTMAKQYAQLLAFAPSHVLLFAGGVGATFAVPMYRALAKDLPSAKTQLELTWSIRSPHDAAWAFSGTDMPLDSLGGTIRLYLTVPVTAEAEGEADGQADGPAPHLPELLHGRPDVPRIVDDTFRRGYEDKVAVLVCGPAGMAREVRAQVRPWVMRGRDVWWHNESFEW